MITLQIFFHVQIYDKCEKVLLLSSPCSLHDINIVKLSAETLSAGMRIMDTCSSFRMKNMCFSL